MNSRCWVKQSGVQQLKCRIKILKILYERLNKKHQKVIEGKIPEIRDSDIYRSLPYSDNVFQDQTAIKVIKEKTGISYQEIADSLNRLIEKCKLVTGFDTRIDYT